MRYSSFSIPVDESTDITSNYHVVAFVRSVNDSEIQENFFCCIELPETSKGIDIFNILSSYLETRGLYWKNCVGICTDGAPPTVGSIKGFISLLKRENPDVISTPCFLHREVLPLKSLGDELKKVFDDDIKMVNFIKQKSVHPGMFKRPCENLNKEHINLLLRTEIRSLSRGTVLNRIFELKDKLQEYFQRSNKQVFAKCFEGKKWPQRLAYLADIFHHMNQLNKLLQGTRENVLTSSDNILAFRRKLNLWKDHVAKANLEIFQQLVGLKSEEGYQQIPILIETHLEELWIRIGHYFPFLSTQVYDWMRDLYSKSSDHPET